MTTLKTTVLRQQSNKDGKFKIKIAVCHKRSTQYITTRFSIDNLSQFKNGQVVKNPDAAIINSKLRSLLYEYQERLDEIKNADAYSCSQIRKMITGKGNPEEKITFQSVCNEYIKEIEERGGQNYARLLERNCRYFIKFAKGDLLLEDITPNVIDGYASYLRRMGTMCETTVGMLMSRTRTVINRGVRQGMVSYNIHPFANFKIKASPARDVSLELENFNKIRLSEFKEKKLRVAKDVFCLSFYLGGINLADLLSIDFKNTSIIEYSRKKCRNTMQGNQTVKFTIPEPAKEIIGTWMNKKTGRLDFGYKLNYSNFYRYLTRCLNNIAGRLGIKEKVVYYSARKSFAQYASEIGIPDAVIDYCLGHSDKGRGVLRFYAKVRQRQAEIAINRVIDYVKHPDKYADIIEMNINAIMMAKL